MIIAAVLKNFKCYKGINVVQFSEGILNYLNIIIGNNGVGKSAVLEALDTLFNDAHWIVNKEAKSQVDTQVASLFLLEKAYVDNLLDAREVSIMADISNFFWHFTPASFVPYRGYESLFDIRNKHVRFEDTHYLVLIGKANNSKLLGFLTFDNKVRDALTVVQKPNDQTLHKLLSKILDTHAFIYIPVESSVSNFVKLQNQSMQMLMDRKIKDEISKKLNEKRITRNKGARELKLSLLDMINEILEAYVNTVEQDIQNEFVANIDNQRVACNTVEKSC